MRSSGVNEALLKGLAALSASLGAQLRQLEQALLQLGMKLYRPQPGDLFDSRLHSPVSVCAQDAPPEETEIGGMETPGVILVGDGVPDEVLIRAVVRTRGRTVQKDA